MKVTLALQHSSDELGLRATIYLICGELSVQLIAKPVWLWL